MNKETTVLFCVNNLGVGGAERLVVSDINEMLRRGISVRLITLKNESKSSLSSELKLDRKYWKVISFGSLLNILSWVRVYSFISKEKPDFLITNLWFANFIGRVVGKICRVKNIITFEQNVYDNLKTWNMFLVDRLIQGFSHHIVAVSFAVKDSLIRHGIDKSKIMVIHNSIDISKYQNNFLNIKDELEVGSKFVYIFVGRIIHQKAVDILVRAFSGVKDSILIIVGQGSDQRKIEDLARELEVDSNIRFLGVRQDIGSLLNSSDCFILPSRYEGLPMVLVEAMASGKAIIVSDFEASKEIITNEVNGLVVEKENVSMLSSAMNRMREDDVLRHRLSQQAKKDSLNFSIINHVNKILEFRSS